MSVNDTNVLAIGGAIAAGVLFLTVFTVLSRFYRRCGADEALVRTGSGGNRVVIGGGVLVYPILHQLLREALRGALREERARDRGQDQGERHDGALHQGGAHRG